MGETVRATTDRRPEHICHYDQQNQQNRENRENPTQRTNRSESSFNQLICEFSTSLSSQM